MSIKKILFITILSLLFIGAGCNKQEMVFGTLGVLPVNQGGTSTSTKPSSGYMLIGNSSGTYDFIASSSLASTGTLGSRIVNTVLVTYDFAIDGGAIGTIALTGAPTIPANAIVRLESFDIVTGVNSATNAGEYQLKIPVDGDFFNSMVWAANGATSYGLLNNNSIKTTAARVPELLIQTENLTSGKINFELSYWVST